MKSLLHNLFKTLLKYRKKLIEKLQVKQFKWVFWVISAPAWLKHFSPFAIYLHFFCYSNSARGCLSSDLSAHKLHRLFNHNCLHTILHHSPWLCIRVLCIRVPRWLPSARNRGPIFAARRRWCRGLLSLPRLATSDPPLPLCLCFTADRRSARAPPARVIYDQQLLLQPMTHTAGCQMWSPCKQKLIWQPQHQSKKAGQKERGGGEVGR